MGLMSNKLREVLLSIMPIVIVTTVMAVTMLHLPVEQFLMFIFCIILVVIGFTIFLTGVEIGINPMGMSIGMEIPRRKSKMFMILIVFIISFLVTVAEPDVSVFSKQVESLFPKIEASVLVYSIAIGVAVFLIIAAAKIVYDLSMRLIITIGYVIVIVLSLVLFFTDHLEFLAISFDAGGVTTGPVTVPILLALGIGICSVKAKSSRMEGFGLTGMASIGPIIALLVVGLITGNSSIDNSTSGGVLVDNIDFHRLWIQFKESLANVLLAIGPLILFFILFQRAFLRYSWTAVKNMSIGVGFAGIGVIIFLTGVYTGFIPVAMAIGQNVDTMGPLGVFLLGAMLGFLVAFAEPAVSILGDQVEASSNGLLSKKKIVLIISLGVAFFVGLGMMKLVLDFPLIWILIPGYVITIVLMWFSDKNMVGIAFDAGGVSTGPMSVAILSSIYLGLAAARYTGTDAVINGFGLIALIALAPCLFLNVLGIYVKHKNESDYYYE